MSPTLLAQRQHRFETDVPPEFAAVAHARCSASEVLRGWRVSDLLIEDIQLVVSELVANSIEHGCGRVALRITEATGAVTIEVTDSSPAPATIRSTQSDSPRGRGLVIVEALAHCWGVSEDGCTTWAAFSSRI